LTGIDPYPLRFEPLYQYRPWGGRRLSQWLSAPLPGMDPVGEAWLFSDRDHHPSVIAEGPLKGRTIGELMQRSSQFLVGGPRRRLPAFPCY
jgi:mannose-6-phosphate isomerase